MKQEFTNFSESVDDILSKLEEAAKKELGAKEQLEQIILDDASEPEAEKARERIIISVQDKDGQQKIRIYKVSVFPSSFMGLL
jgi:competence protein ComGF